MDIHPHYLLSIKKQAERDEQFLLPEDRPMVFRMNYLLQLIIGQMFIGKNHEKFYPNVPFSSGAFIDLMKKAKQVCKVLKLSEKPKFLDVGCGLGHTLLLAEACGFEAHGLDRCKKYVRLARKAISKERVFLANAMEFSDYGNFDVIYWYNPIRDRKMMAMLEAKIVKDSRRPCVFLSAFDNGFFDWGNEVFDVPRWGNPGKMYVKCSGEHRERLEQMPKW